jgi:tetratricopeptide (TPR) repeat protein
MVSSEDTRNGARLPEFVADLEAELQRDSANLEARGCLIDFYYEELIRSDAPWGGPFHDAWAQHVYWLIEHRPESKLAGRPNAMVQPPCGTKENYQEGKQLWLKQVDLQSNNPAILVNAAHYLRINDAEIAESLLQRAYTLRPGDPDVANLLSSLCRRIAMRSETSQSKKQELAQKALTLGEQSLNASPIDRFYRLDDVAEAALEAGEFVKAERYAHELLADAPKYESNWDYGNAIHNGNLILGRLAVQNGNLEEACEYLLKAGETRGSPQLGSFGPNMDLARELLEHGQREVVIKYFESCERFWEMGQDRLRNWRVDVEQGRVPDFGA